MRTFVVVSLSALWALEGSARADDAAVLAELRKAGLSAGHYRPGGYSVSVKSATDLKEDVWKLLEGFDLRYFWLSDASAFGDAEMARLSGIKSLEYIFLNSPRVTETGITALGKLPHLREFNVHHLGGKDVFRGAGLVALKDTPGFEAMEFGGATIDDKGMDAIGQLVHLKKLGIYHAEITTVGFSNFAKLVNLEKLALEPTFTPNYTGSDFRHLEGLAELQELLVKKMVLSYDDGLSHLAKLKRLKKLTFVECGIGEDDLARLKGELSETKIEFTPASAKDVARWNDLLSRRAKK